MLLVDRSQERDVEGVVGSCNVVGVQDRVHVGGEATVHALVHINLGDGPNVGTLGSSVVGNCGRRNIGDGMLASIFFVPWW
jgi:hypothetical protein